MKVGNRGACVNIVSLKSKIKYWYWTARFNQNYFSDFLCLNGNQPKDDDDEIILLKLEKSTKTDTFPVSLTLGTKIEKYFKNSCILV